MKYGFLTPINIEIIKHGRLIDLNDKKLIVVGRNESELIGEGAEIDENQFVFPIKKEHFDLTTNIHHIASRTKGNSLIKGMMKDKGRAVMMGLIDVEQEAKFVNSHLLELGLLLNTGAKADLYLRSG
jgi:Fe-S cluster assembly scaffold protein SufB